MQKPTSLISTEQYPEYTEREKDMRINEFKAIAMLETVRMLLSDTQRQLDDKQSQLNHIQQLIHDMSLELIKHTHNVGAIIDKVDGVTAKLKGGDPDVDTN